MTNLYERVLSICKKRELSIYALERAACITRNSIQKWKNSLPVCSSVLAVAQYLDVSVDYLLGNSENPYSHKTEPVYDTVGFVASLEEIRAVVDQKIAETKNQGKAADETEVSNTADIDEK